MSEKSYSCPNCRELVTCTKWSLYGVMCEPCQDKERAEQQRFKEQKIIAAAEVVEWDGCALCELDGSEYFDGAEELVEKFILSNDTPLRELDLPRYMHPCDIEHIEERVDVDELAEHICEKLMDEHGYEVEVGEYWPEFDKESLKIHLENWLSNQEIFFFKEDTFKVVDLTEFWEKTLADFEGYDA